MFRIDHACRYKTKITPISHWITFSLFMIFLYLCTSIFYILKRTGLRFYIHFQKDKGLLEMYRNFLQAKYNYNSKHLKTTQIKRMKEKNVNGGKQEILFHLLHDIKCIKFSMGYFITSLHVLLLGMLPI